MSEIASQIIHALGNAADEIRRLREENAALRAQVAAREPGDDGQPVEKPTTRQVLALAFPPPDDCEICEGLRYWDLKGSCVTAVCEACGPKPCPYCGRARRLVVYAGTGKCITRCDACRKEAIDA